MLLYLGGYQACAERYWLGLSTPKPGPTHAEIWELTWPAQSLSLHLPHAQVCPFLDLRWQFTVLENITRNLKITIEKESQNMRIHGWCLPPLNLAWGISCVQTFYTLPSLCSGFACFLASSPSFREICPFPKDNQVVHIEPQCPSSLGIHLILQAPPQTVWPPAQAHWGPLMSRGPLRVGAPCSQNPSCTCSSTRTQRQSCTG